MLSTALEVCGLACAVAAALLAWGPAAAFAVASPCLLFLGFAAEGAKLPRPRLRVRLRLPQRRRAASRRVEA